MSFHVDAWDPSYGASLDASEPATADGLDTDVEIPAHQWRPVAAPPGVRPPAGILMGGRIRRNDARIWTVGEPLLPPTAGLAASYAAGVVRCTSGGGMAT